MSDVLQSLISDLRHFADEREWAQFHSPKNLATALSIEAAELQEVFLWLTEQQSRNLSPKQLAKAREELGDVCLYLLQLSDKLGVDLLQAAREKLAVNAEKYPVELARGRSDKYDEL